MYPGTFAATKPDKLAVIRPATGESITYAQLDERSTRAAHYLRGLGLVPGDHLAVVATNDIRVLEVYWGALRSGLYITAVNHHLTADEVNYILDDCEAKVLFASADCAAAVDKSDEVAGIDHRVAWGASIPGFEDYDALMAAASSTPLTDQPRGVDMLYSSGTTGRPKGIMLDLPGTQIGDGPDRFTAIFAPLYGFDADTVYLSPAPLYHAAPLRYCGMVNSVGGTLVMMDRFDAEEALSLIDKYQVTHSQWVPTMFIRMLKLPKDVRDRYNVSSMKCAIHAAAPCPAEVKRGMIEWWGPVIQEYYASTESAGATFISATEALERPGSVGRSAMGPIRICADDGAELPIGETGTIYFEREEMPFAYHNDPGKTAAAQHPEHSNWATTGDVGYLDDDGYLYLTDRKSFMIISGGVNIYPQEAENVLIGHPAVYDVGVIGVPDDELGEQVKACVQLEPGTAASDELAAELIEFTRERLAHYKAPKSVDFVDDLPRTPTGKLVKGKLRARYW